MLPIILSVGVHLSAVWYIFNLFITLLIASTSFFIYPPLNLRRPTKNRPGIIHNKNFEQKSDDTAGISGYPILVSDIEIVPLLTGRSFREPEDRGGN